MDQTKKEKNCPPLKIAYAGFGRCGTHSIAAALKKLGYKPCHGESMAKFAGGSHRVLIEAIEKGDIDSILEETSNLGYDCTMEVHAAFWKEIRAKCPETKFIIRFREKDKLIQSHKELWKYDLGPTLGVFQKYLSTRAIMIRRMTQGIVDQRWRSVGLEQPKTIRSVEDYFDAIYEPVYKDLAEFAKEEPDRVLVFDLKDGYPALCKFLNIKEEDWPQEEFPRISTSKDLKNIWMRKLPQKILGFLISLPVLVVIGLPLLVIFRLCQVIKMFVEKLVLLPLKSEHKAEKKIE